MFFKTGTVYKTFSTERGALNFITKSLAGRQDVSVEFCGGIYMVVSA